MRAARVVELAGGYYHLISRVIERKMILDEGEKERIRKIMRARSTGTRIEHLSPKSGEMLRKMQG
jgi:hypothetical protein